MRFLFLLVCALVNPAGYLANAAAAPIMAHQLDNGLKIIIKRDHRAPIVVSQVWYRVGSSYEYSGITGISHLLEHMMFKGTERYPEGEFSAIVAQNGGEENAFTGSDYTAYYELFAADRLRIAFELEADRMRNLALTEDAFTREREVVKEERRWRTEDEPTSLVYEHFNATAFFNSPYGNPVIGWMADIEGLTLAELNTWYRQWYAPNNAILVVVGDIEPANVIALAQRYFGGLATAPTPMVKPRREVEQRGLRRIKVRAPANVPYLLMGYKVPSLATAENDWEAYALEVLAHVLDGGNSARLARNVIRGQEIAARCGAGYRLTARLDSLFLFDGQPTAEHTIADLETALLGEIDRVRRQPVSAAELARVKAQVIAGEIFARDSVQHQAIQLGLYETIGLGWRVAESYPERIGAVTAEQVQQVARKYLIAEHLTVAELVPEPIASAATPSVAANHNNLSVKE